MDKGRKKKFLKILLIFLFFANFLAWLKVYDLSEPQALEVIFFDIGQGDSIFIETSEKHQILIDGGPDSRVLEKLGKVMPFWDRTLDLVISTHPERDHLQGLIEVLKNYKVENILWTGVVTEGALYRQWLKALALEDADIYIAKAGQRIEGGGIVLEILYPFEELVNRKCKNLNDTSIVIHLIFKKTSFLFAGDISKNIERKIILKEEENLDSDLLKVAHHGSKTSSSEEFLKAVSPLFAVISVGANHYGHPSLEVLQRLENFKIKILRTDREGDIKIVSDGVNLKLLKEN